MIADNGNIIDLYEDIPVADANGNFEYKFPGAYCKSCGRTFLVYPYSIYRPVPS